ncbi:MAG: hypothetical protein V3T82_08020 [Nitrospinaceae bacterium]
MKLLGINLGLAVWPFVWKLAAGKKAMHGQQAWTLSLGPFNLYLAWPETVSVVPSEKTQGEARG